MDTSQLSPYLNFNGDCEEAMQFYQSILGGKLEISRFSDFGATGVPADYASKVMHSTLTNGSMTFMASDAAPGRPVNFGDSVQVSLAGKDEAALTKAFEALSAGGTVTMPLEKQVWGDQFGMLTDKYDIHWMVNIGMASAGS